MVSIRQDMLVAAGRGPSLLGDRLGPTADFVHRQLASDGGFKDRHGESDLYYTVFGAQCLLALGQRLPEESLGAYVAGFGDGDGLDLVHLACLARLHVALGGAPAEVRAVLIERIASCRTTDGGYALTPQAGAANVYAGFMALSALQDLDAPPDDPSGLLASADACRRPDGGYANQAGIPLAITPTTAAAVVLRLALGEPPEAATLDWLRVRQTPGGGFVAADGAPEADLLSTAVAVHGLAAAGEDLSAIAPPARPFVETLYCDGGGFRGHATGDSADCEYTFYGLLALGRLGAA